MMLTRRGGFAITRCGAAPPSAAWTFAEARAISVACLLGDVALDLYPVLQLAVHLHDHRYPLLGEQAYVGDRPRPRVNVVSVAMLVGLSGEVGGERCQQLQQGVDRLVDDGHDPCPDRAWREMTLVSSMHAATAVLKA